MKQEAEQSRAAVLMEARTAAPACCPLSSLRWMAWSQPQVSLLGRASLVYILAASFDNGHIVHSLLFQPCR